MTNTDDPWAAHRDAEAPQASDMARVAELVRIMLQREAEVEEANQILAEKQRALQEIQQHELPELMRSFGLDSVTTIDGHQLSIKEKVRAHISKERAYAAHRFVEDDGNDGIIKRSVVIPFGRERREEAIEMLDAMRTSYPDAHLDESIHPSTLRSYVAKKLEAGDGIPMDLFGVHVSQYADVKRKK